MSTQVEPQRRIEQRDELDSDLEYDGIKVIQEYMLKAEIGESPIDINLSRTIPISLPPLQWHHHELPPKKMKCTNTGHTLIMSAKWHQERPHISGGPLFGNYVFSQLHFHWGRNDMEGSEHTVDGSQQPLEMHVVLFKSCYLTQEAALKKKDGIVVLVYFFRLQEAHNVSMELITQAISYIQTPHSSARLDNVPLSFLTIPFIKDYFMYWGTVTTSECVHCLLWLLCREPIGISIDQTEQFRTLLNMDDQPLDCNFRIVQEIPGLKRTVFHANPSFSLYSTLLPIKKEERKQEKKKDAKKEEKQEPVQVENKPAEVFRVETRQRNPFKEEKNKYTISTSIKVDPELLEKLKTSRSRSPSVRREGDMGSISSFDAKSGASGRSSSPVSKTGDFVGKRFVENVNVKPRDKSIPRKSMIPRRVK
ncbi:carbonic anhydrase 3-like [Onthophagus taurus]|uniref:carbonic anhydrase 3-like n=1 Tax=Onthophagus taurus TaxID=166361 RepID=UPI000C20BF91|nr:carbonic anhydrase 3-like [Onthophagus taurus]